MTVFSPHLIRAQNNQTELLLEEHMLATRKLGILLTFILPLISIKVQSTRRLNQMLSYLAGWENA